jgi:di/tricarboxylate transporter
MVPTAVASAFLNNTPVVAMLMPIINDWARKLRLSVSHLLLPLSYAAILGGMCTLIGTSTTLVVNGELIKEQARLGEPGRGISLFEIAWVGVPAMLAGLAYLVACGRWLIPDRKPAMEQLDDPREYTLEMIVQRNSPLVGKTIEAAGLRHLPGTYLMEIEREGHVIAAVASSERLQGDDRLVFCGIVESVVDLQKLPGLVPAVEKRFRLDDPNSERRLIEAVVSDSCPIVGMTIRESRFRARYNAAVIAVSRNAERVNKKIGDIQLRPGDTLLLEAESSFVELQRNSRDFFLVSEVEDSAPVMHEKAFIAQAVLGAMILLVLLAGLSMLKAAMLAAGLMLLFRCCRSGDAKRAIDWSVLLCIGAGIGIGEALQASGADEFLARGTIDALGDRPLLVLAAVYGVTMVFTNLITAKAAAVLIFPIAMATAHKLGVDIMPFAIVVMAAAAASFATPIGYQTNLMVLGPGGYRYMDYVRIGGPLSLLIWALTVAITPLVWPFHP